ncbi:MAG: hypothetical protein QOI91_2587 [Solirubrobacteraceae bacterium]|jgi:uncharacterized protein (DUF1501 family)|nr:hypothetical protein [Solirubrobacteraceae bacterium]
MRNAHRACDDFRQTSAAQRNRWLEPSLTRRQILMRGIGAGLAVYASQAMPFARILEAAEAQAATAPNAPVLVSVFLPGGLDLLSALPPLGQYGRYVDLRGGVKVDAPPPLGATGLGIHPSLAKGTNGGIKGLFDAGKVGLLPGIDYANPDLSHFHSRHFWETGLITQNAAPGWMGRWLDRHGSSDNPLQGLSVSHGLSPVMRSGRAPVAAVSSPNDARLWMRDVWGTAYDTAMDTWGRIASTRPGAAGPSSAYEAARLAKEVGDRLAPYRRQNGTDPLAPAVAYPADNDFADRLSVLGALIAQPLGIRVATVEAGGDFDTHDNQPAELESKLGEVSQALSAFQADLEARGVADRVLTLVWSEFGRRPQANESNGTDHGAGGIAWVQGTRARGGVHTDYPSLTAFDGEDNLKVTVDFRSVYASLLESWLGTGADEVIPNSRAFRRLSLVA